MVDRDMFRRDHCVEWLEYLEKKPKDWSYYRLLVNRPWQDPRTLEVLRDPTQEELLVTMRGRKEADHLDHLLHKNVRKGLFKPEFPPSGSPPRMRGLEAWDCCNKTIALYTVGHTTHDRPETLPIFNYVYRKWLRPYKNHIEFNQFIAKFIDIKLGQSYEAYTQSDSVEELQGVVQSILQLHHNVIHGVHEAINRGIPLWPRWVPYAAHFSLKRLFESMIIVTKKIPSGVQKDLSQMHVYLILTGIDTGLSAPISFETIYAKGQALNLNSDHGYQPDLVLTTLEVALDFVQEMERREEAAHGVHPDPAIAYPNNYFMDWIREAGWKGEDPVGPSDLWVDTSRCQNWNGSGSVSYDGLLHQEDPSLTTSRKLIEQKYDPSRFVPAPVPKKRQRGSEKEVEDDDAKKLKTSV